MCARARDKKQWRDIMNEDVMNERQKMGQQISVIIHKSENRYMQYVYSYFFMRLTFRIFM